MKKCIKCLFAVLFCCTVTGVNAQSNESTSPPQKGVKVKIDSVKRVPVCRVDFTNRGKPIQKGDTVIINVTWNPQTTEPGGAIKVVLDSVYTPTPKEVKKGEYTVVVKPERTTTYSVTIYHKSGEKFSYTQKIVVLDKKGMEIKEEEVEANKKK